MPQTPQNLIAKNPAGAFVSLKTDADGALLVTAPDSPLPAAPQTHFNISAATVVKATPGTVLRFNVVTAGTAAGTINDCATTGDAAASNAVATIPEVVGPVALEWPCATGIVVVPGAGQVISILFA